MPLVEVNETYLDDFKNSTADILAEYNEAKQNLTYYRPKGTSGYKLCELINEDGNTEDLQYFPTVQSIISDISDTITVQKMAVTDVSAEIKESPYHTEAYPNDTSWRRLQIPLKVCNEHIKFFEDGSFYEWEVGKAYRYTSPNTLHGSSSDGLGTAEDNRVMIILDLYDEVNVSAELKQDIYDVSVSSKNNLLERITD